MDRIFKLSFRLVLFCLMVCIVFSLFMAIPVRAAVAVEKIKLNKTSLTLTINQIATLRATVKPATLKKSLKWKSSNKKVVMVSTKGKITAKKPGKAKIIAYIGRKKVICMVTVVDYEMVFKGILGFDLPENATIKRCKIKNSYGDVFLRMKVYFNGDDFERMDCGIQEYLGTTHTTRSTDKEEISEDFLIDKDINIDDIIVGYRKSVRGKYAKTRLLFSYITKDAQGQYYLYYNGILMPTEAK